MKLRLLIRLVRFVREHLLVANAAGGVSLEPQELVREEKDAQNGEDSEKTCAATPHEAETRSRERHLEASG